MMADKNLYAVQNFNMPCKCNSCNPLDTALYDTLDTFSNDGMLVCCLHCYFRINVISLIASWGQNKPAKTGQ